MRPGRGCEIIRGGHTHGNHYAVHSPGGVRHPLAALILTVITNIITQVVKKITWDKIPTNILAVVVAMAVTLVAFFAACQIMGWAVTWYMVAGAVALGQALKEAEAGL